MPNVQRSTDVAQTAVNRSESQPVAGLYFGTSDDQFGRRAWLLRLDSKTGRGRVYMPPEKLELSNVTVDTTGQLTFRSEAGLGDVTYSFEGHVTSDGITGTFSITRARPSTSAEVRSALVTFKNLNPESLDESSGTRLSGLYSNVEYNEEGGDLTGAELILIPDKGGLIGIFTSYENEMLPYAVTDITQLKDSIQFKTRTATGEEHYRGVLSRNRLTLRRVDTDADPEAEPIVLFKRSSRISIL